LQELAELAKNLNSQVGPLASSLKDTIREYGKLAKDTDAQVLRTSNAAQDAIRELGRLAQEVERAVSLVSMNLGRTLESADSAAEQARKSLDSIERITEENSPLVQGFTNAMEEMASAARSIRVLADYLSRHPEALLQGKGSPKGR